MSITIKIGLDPEFMAKYKGSYIYPRLGRSNPAISGLPKATLDTIAMKLARTGADEFGHCVEIRPKEATDGKQLVLNTIDTMATLPEDFCYYGENTHRMDKALFIKLVRTLGRKELSESKNIYGQDILDDCPADLKARKVGKRLLFCGCHMHVSATEKVSITQEGKTFTEERNVKLPEKALVALFDKYIFDAMANNDPGFKAGRYRSPGFYETKTHGGFEYRSLGASALTPKRLRLIADIMIYITKQVIDPKNVSELLFNEYAGKPRTAGLDFKTELQDMVADLIKTRCVQSDLRSLWVPF